MSAPAVVVVGGGPAGLAAATELGRLGVGAVVVLERETEPGGIPRHAAHQGFGARDLRRCLRPSYRLGLMAPGQRCLLWLSGSHQPGVHAVGTLVGRPRPASGDGRGAPEVAVSLLLLAEPLPRAELASAPAFAGAEVLRMPAGSNPSYLTPAQLRVVLDRLEPAVLARDGWAGRSVREHGLGEPGQIRPPDG